LSRNGHTQPPEWHFDSCAVVGNSGALLQRETGAEIDGHAAVFRINYAPTQGTRQLQNACTPPPR
jgi:hypothetical protein